MAVITRHKPVRQQQQHIREFWTSEQMVRKLFDLNRSGEPEICRIFDVKASNRMSLATMEIALQKMLLESTFGEQAMSMRSSLRSTRSSISKSKPVRLNVTKAGKKNSQRKNVPFNQKEVSRMDSCIFKTESPEQKKKRPASQSNSNSEKRYSKVVVWDSSSSISSREDVNIKRLSRHSHNTHDSIVGPMRSYPMKHCSLPVQPPRASRISSFVAPRRILSLYSGIHGLCSDIGISSVYHSFKPRGPVPHHSFKPRTTLPGANSFADSLLPKYESDWVVPSADELSWIPFQANDPVNVYIYNTCCQHSDSCPHRRLAASVMEEDCFLHEEDLLTVDAAGETLMHTAARWGASLDLISFLLSRLTKPDVTNLRGETFVHLLRPSQTRGFWEAFPHMLADVLHRGFNPALLDCEGRSCLTRLVHDLATSADPALYKYEVLDALLTKRAGSMLQCFLPCVEAGGTVALNLIATLRRVAEELRAEGLHLQAGGALYHMRNLESTLLSSTPNSPAAPRELDPDAHHPNRVLVTGQTELMALASDLSTMPSATAHAARGGIFRLEHMLASASPDLRLQDRNGDTVLHQAIAAAAPAVVRALVRCGADSRVRNLAGRSGLDVAEEMLAREKRLSLAFAHRVMVLVALRRALRRGK